jgi:capsular exopolysaccharide synthesis family protein
MITSNVVRLLRQHAVVLLLLVMLAAGVAGAQAGRRTSSFRAEGQLLLAQVDANDQLGAATPERIDADRYVANEIEVLESQPVVDAALAAGASASALGSLEVAQVGESDVVRIATTAPTAEQAEVAVEAVIGGYLELSRAAAQRAAERQATELDRRLLAVAERLGAAGARVADPATGPTERAVLEAQRDADAGTYADLSAERQRLLARVGLAGGGAEVVEPPGRAEPVAAPGAFAAAAGAAFAMATVAVGALVVREKVHDRITGRAQVESLDLGVRVFGELPEVHGLDDGSPTPMQDRSPDGAFGGAVRMLRRAIDMAWELKPNTAVLVTSPGRFEGRTSVVANLGTAYARAGVATLVVDADLRRPGLSALLDLPVESGGLTAVLEGRVSAYEATVETRVHGMRALPAGPAPPDPLELLASERATTAHHDAADDEIVIVDGPALQETEGAGLIASSADAVLVVVRVGHTSVPALEAAVEELRQLTAAPIGIVLNRVPRS